MSRAKYETKIWRTIRDDVGVSLRFGNKYIQDDFFVVFFPNNEFQVRKSNPSLISRFHDVQTSRQTKDASNEMNGGGRLQAS